MPSPASFWRHSRWAQSIDYTISSSQVQDLERITFNAYERDDNDWDLHFHLEDGPCRARVNRFVWNTGYYLRTQAFQDGKLQVLAHFVYTEGEPKRAPALRVSLAVTLADYEGARIFKSMLSPFSVS